MCRPRMAASTASRPPARRPSRPTLATVRRQLPSTCASAADLASVQKSLPPPIRLTADRLRVDHLTAAAVAGAAALPEAASDRVGLVAAVAVADLAACLGQPMPDASIR